MPQEGSHHIQKVGFIQKGSHQKHIFNNTTPLQSFFYTLHWDIQKVKNDLTSWKRSSGKSEKLVKFSTVIFPLPCHFNMLKKKVASSLSNYRLVDHWGTKLKICKLQRSYFEVYIKLEYEEKERDAIKIFPKLQ